MIAALSDELISDYTVQSYGEATRILIIGIMGFVQIIAQYVWSSTTHILRTTNIWYTNVVTNPEFHS